MDQNSKKVTIYCDGASRGNPGQAATGVHIIDSNSGGVLLQHGTYLGKRTNNEAEYLSLIEATSLLHDLTQKEGFHVEDLRIHMDSELVCFQIQGKYRVKKENLRPLYEKAVANLSRFPRWSISPIPRAQNKEADRMANNAIDGAINS